MHVAFTTGRRSRDISSRLCAVVPVVKSLLSLVNSSKTDVFNFGALRFADYQESNSSASSFTRISSAHARAALAVIKSKSSTAILFSSSQR